MANRFSKRKDAARKGVVLMITTLMMLFIVLPSIGLAVDGAVLYSVRARLQNASDGAAIAAARSLSRGLNSTQQQNSATATAVKFYNANIDATWPGLVTPDPVVTFPASTSPRTTRINVVATAEAPTYFMKIMNKNSVVITSISEAVRRDVNIMMVLDRSGSMDTAGACDDLREAAKGFIDSFVDGRDKIGLVTFGTTYRVDFAMSSDFKSKAAPNDMKTIVNNITCVGGTNTAAAYWTAYQQFLANPEAGVLNVILLFTDGKPNTVYLPSMEVKTSSGCTNKTAKAGVVTPAGSNIRGIFLAAAVGPPPLALADERRYIANSNGCSYFSNFDNVPNDILAMAPLASEVDFFGNSLTGWKSVSRIPTGSTGAGRIKINDADTLTNAGINALDSAASRVRAATSGANGLNIATFAIALGTPSDVEEDLLERVANVPEAGTAYNSSQPVGLYVRADNPSQLDEAFSQLASDVMRFAK